MPVRDESELTDRLDGDIAWRKHELSTIRLAVEREAKHVKVAMIRAGVCLLYAHWEGFVGATARSYLEYVANRKLMHRELQRNFLALEVRRNIEQTASLRSISEVSRTVAAILDSGPVRMGTLDTKAIKEAINTRSNLNSKVLKEILLTVGFSNRGYLSKGNLLDERLLGSRNRIAHGQRVELDALEYFELHGAIIELMERFKSDVELAVSAKSYRA